MFDKTSTFKTQFHLLQPLPSLSQYSANDSVSPFFKKTLPIKSRFCISNIPDCHACSLNVESLNIMNPLPQK